MARYRLAALAYRRTGLDSCESTSRKRSSPTKQVKILVCHIQTSSRNQVSKRGTSLRGGSAASSSSDEGALLSGLTMLGRMMGTRKAPNNVVIQGHMAETKGFEPSRRFPVCTLSRGVPSTTRPRLRRLVYRPDLMSASGNWQGWRAVGLCPAGSPCRCRAGLLYLWP